MAVMSAPMMEAMPPEAMDGMSAHMKYMMDKIEVYDINGRHINTLLNKRLDAGYHDYTWKPSSLASGIYLINVQVGENNLTHKVMFVK